MNSNAAAMATLTPQSASGVSRFNQSNALTERLVLLEEGKLRLVRDQRLAEQREARGEPRRMLALGEAQRPRAHVREPLPWHLCVLR